MINNEENKEIRIQKYNSDNNTMYIKYVDDSEEWIEFESNDGYKISEDGVLFLAKKVKHYKNSKGFECWCKYDSAGNIIKYKDNQKRKYTRKFKNGNLVSHSIKDHYNVEYDDCGNILEYKNRYGIKEKYEYDEYGNVIYYKSSTGYSYKYDSNNRVSYEIYKVDKNNKHEFGAKINDTIHITRYYDENGNQTLYVDNYGYKYFCDYDEYDNITKSSLYINGVLQEMK